MSANRSMEEGEQAANARLIAAATTMKETLEEIAVGLQFLIEARGDVGGRIVSMMAQVDAALAATE